MTSVVLFGLLARHWTNFYRFLRSPDWNTGDVSRVLYPQCLDVAVVGKRVLLGLDDTVCAKFGECFAGLSIHHAPMNKEHPKHLARGHCCVCLAALGRQGAAHWVALFVSCALYVQKKACAKTQPFTTKLALAVALLDPLPTLADLLVVVVCDGAYAKQHFGLSIYQVRNQTGFVRLVPLCLWAQTLLRLRRPAAP